MAAFTEIWRRFRSASALWKLIILNISVFLALRLLGIIAMIGGWNIDTVVDELALPSAPHILASQPWTVLTYMFTHYDPFHILFNLLTLYWFGKIMLWRCSPRQMVWLYIYGGVSGAIFYLIAAQLFAGVGGLLLGASAAVMAIMTATAVMMPDFSIPLMFIGNVRLKWVAVAAVILFALGLVGDNAGGHVAHFGGIAMGCAAGLLFNRGIDITRPVNSLCDKFVGLLRRGRTNHAQSRPKAKFRPQPKRDDSGKKPNPDDDRRNLDAILDKIKHSGYTALTADERRRLFEISKRVK